MQSFPPGEMAVGLFSSPLPRYFLFTKWPQTKFFSPGIVKRHNQRTTFSTWECWINTCLTCVTWTECLENLELPISWGFFFYGQMLTFVSDGISRSTRKAGSAGTDLLSACLSCVKILGTFIQQAPCGCAASPISMLLRWGFWKLLLEDIPPDHCKTMGL